MRGDIPYDARTLLYVSSGGSVKLVSLEIQLSDPFDLIHHILHVPITYSLQTFNCSNEVQRRNLKVPTSALCI